VLEVVPFPGTVVLHRRSSSVDFAKAQLEERPRPGGQALLQQLGAKVGSRLLNLPGQLGYVLTATNNPRGCDDPMAQLPKQAREGAVASIFNLRPRHPGRRDRNHCCRGLLELF